MMTRNKFLVSSVCAVLMVACGSNGDDDGSSEDRPENTGAACITPADCYPDVDPEAIQGEVSCLDRVRDGYCTHLCVNDDECCAAEGECKEGVEQV